MKTLFKFFAQRHLLANALTVMILLLGGYSLMTINREEFPNADTSMVTVNARYAGASPEDVELEVTNELEDALSSVIGIKTMSSTSSENSASIRIEIDEDEDADEVYNDIVEAVNGVNGLPDDVDTPNVMQMNPKMKPILMVGISSGELDYRELRDYVHQFEKKLLDVDGVAEVSLSGYQDREVRIEVTPDKLMKYGLSLTEVSQAIAARNIRASGGAIKMESDYKNLITLATFSDPADVEDVILKSYDNGAVIRISDVATVSDTFVEAKSLQRINGNPTISARITKSASADIIRTSDAVKALIADEEASFQSDTIQFTMTEDDSVNVRDKFEIVKTNGMIGLILVFLVLALFLNIGISFWVAMGIPVSLMGTLMLLPFFDIELDSLTMAAMVLVLGIIVDDAIVIAENIFQHRERGEAPLEAAVNGVREVALPVFTTVATTILAFIPMLFIEGMLGKFIFVIPLTVITALTMSMLESYFILPAHLLPGLQGGKQQKVGRGWFRPIRQWFERVLLSLLSLRYVWLCLACTVLAASVMHATSSFRFTLMERGSNVETIDLTLELPLGTALETTSEKTKEFEEILLSFPKTEISSFSATIGSGGRRDVQASHLAMLTLYLPPASEMTRTADEITSDIREQAETIEGVELTFGRTMRGPPTGDPIEIMVKGADEETRNAAVEAVIAFLETIEGVEDLENDNKAGNDEVLIQPKYALLSRYGLSVSTLSQAVKTTYQGSEATSTRYGDEDVAFTVILEEEYRKDLEYLKRLQISNGQGELINLEEVADFTVQAGAQAIYHEDGEPTTTVSGDIDEDTITALEVMELVEEHFDFNTMRQYPGVRLDIGGEAADSQQAIQDILLSFAMAAIGIYFLLMLLFNSLTQPFVVLMTIPFGVAGVIWAFALHGITQTSFFAGIGVIGLAGVVVNDALVMVDHLNNLIRSRKDKTVLELIAEGAANRLRPVILTTITTVIGLIPLAYGIGGEDTMMGPMAMSLGYGLLFATPITLILLPCLYMIREDLHSIPGQVKHLFRRKELQELTVSKNLETTEI